MYLIIAAPMESGWTVHSVTARTKRELKAKAIATLREFLMEEYLILPKRCPKLRLARYGDGDERTNFVLEKLFERAMEKDVMAEGDYPVKIFRHYMSLQVPHKKRKKQKSPPMKRVIEDLVKEIEEILMLLPS